VADEAFAAERRLEEAPPVSFDVARQVRVFNAYLHYVELNLSGAPIQCAIASRSRPEPDIPDQCHVVVKLAHGVRQSPRLKAFEIVSASNV
jgi:hypothetical protein